MRRSKVKTGARPTAGDLILAGHPGTSMPGEWWLARVLWLDGDDMLTEHTPSGGEKYRQVLHVGHVRAIGTIPELREFRERAREAVQELSKRVSAVELELHAARAAVWAKLDEIGADVPRLTHSMVAGA